MRKLSLVGLLLSLVASVTASFSELQKKEKITFFGSCTRSSIGHDGGQTGAMLTCQPTLYVDNPCILTLGSATTGDIIPSSDEDKSNSTACS